MDHDQDAYQRRRETFLTVFLAVIGGLAILCFLILITLGYILWIIPGVAAVAALGLFHYLLWGRMFSQSVAGEREEAELQANLEANDWDLPEPRRPRHY
jgi:Flp pilus assembly protein TadB